MAEEAVADRAVAMPEEAVAVAAKEETEAEQAEETEFHLPQEQRFNKQPDSRLTPGCGEMTSR